jgi:hypothetical protein
VAASTSEDVWAPCPVRGLLAAAQPGRGRLATRTEAGAAAMTASIGLLGLFAELAILAALAAAVVSPRLSLLARALVATLAFACAWLLSAVLAALRAPVWATAMGCALIVISIVVITVTIHLWAQAGVGGEHGRGQQDDEGKGGPRRRRPDAPQPGGGGTEPSWWPEFERQLAFYVAEGEREKRQPAVPEMPLSPLDGVVLTPDHASATLGDECRRGRTRR